MEFIPFLISSKYALISRIIRSLYTTTLSHIYARKMGYYCRVTLGSDKTSWGEVHIWQRQPIPAAPKISQAII